MVATNGRAATGVRPEPLQSGRFAIEVQGLLVAHFTELSGLTVEVTFKDVEEGGNNEYVDRLPGPLKYTNITLKKGVTDSQAFMQWRPVPTAQKIQVQRKNISIKLFNAAGQTIKQWDVTGAYPIKWVGPDLKASDFEMVVESVELAHRGWKEVK